MPFFLRKSFSIGPLRINFSKSGLGASVGVKGFRVGTRPDGRSYVHAGRGGLYYREELGRSSPERPSELSEEGRRSIGIGLVLVVIGFVLVIGVVLLFVYIGDRPRTGSAPASRPVSAVAAPAPLPTFAPTSPPLVDDAPYVEPPRVVEKKADDGSREFQMQGGSIKAGRAKPTSLPWKSSGGQPVAPR